MRIFIVVFILASSASATTRTAATCSVADIQTQVNLSSDGDTVLVPGSASCPTGSHATWNTTLTVGVGITLNGQNSFINFGTSGELALTSDTGAGLLVEGFNWNNGFINGGCPITWNITQSTKPGRFTGNTYTDNGSAGQPVTMLCPSGNGTLLIDTNTFTATNGADELIHLLGPGGSWTDDLIPGTPNMIYIETNVYNNNGGVESSAEEAFGGAEFAFRDNTLNLDQNDVHNGTLGARWAEIYSNTYHIAGSFPLANYAQFRGGSGLYYGNHSVGSQCCSDPNPTMTFGPDCPSSDTCTGTWPVALQVGRGYNTTTYSPAYAWGNDTIIQSGISASGGQSLVVVGASTSGCTGGHAGNVCDAIATTGLPSLVRCQSAADVSTGCPVGYTYTAFTYPYPLDANGFPLPSGGGGGTGGSTVVGPVTHLGVSVQF